MPTDKERVKMLSNALRWEKYAKSAPKWAGRKGALKRARKGQAKSVEGYTSRALRGK